MTLLQVGTLLSRDSVKNRMISGDGLSFTEMSYQLMQAHDFAFLHKEFGCTVQLGGADQWGNIIGGIELVRKVHNAEVHAMTIPLVLNSLGEKLGKSAGNAVWLSQDMTSLYSFRFHVLFHSFCDFVHQATGNIFSTLMMRVRGGWFVG